MYAESPKDKNPRNKLALTQRARISEADIGATRLL